MTCRVCRGPLTLLGRLGRLLHLRCRDCGLSFTRREPPRPFLREILEENRPDGRTSEETDR